MRWLLLLSVWWWKNHSGNKPAGVLSPSVWWMAVILDPKSERGNWKETPLEIAEEINICKSLPATRKMQGSLDPFVNSWKR